MRLFVFAGEPSGDALGASLLEALHKKNPAFSFYGVGGPLMRKNNFETILEMEKFQVMGFTDVFKAIFKLLRFFKFLKNHLLNAPPEAVILIDYAEWNMRFAKALRKGGYKGKIIQYVSPTVWAWRKNRVKQLAQNCDLLLSILPFEKSYYEGTTLSVCYVGHPLVNEIPIPPPKKRYILSLFPGSRLSEIRLNLPLQLKAVKGLSLPIAVSVAREDLKEEIEKLIAQSDVPCLLVPFQERYSLMQESKVALATCGTVNLELALQETPTVVTYKLPFLNYLIGRFVFGIHLSHYSLPNILLNKTLYPEFVQLYPRVAKIRKAIQKLLKEKNTEEKCRQVRFTLEDVDASERAANAICQILN